MRVLISAYACEPGRGSEAGAGWLWTLAAAANHDVWLLTRATNRTAVDAGLAGAGIDSIQTVYVDLPRWARVWKRGGRGVRIYYALWQVLAALQARRLHRVERFDLVHHVTFANVWVPALACCVPAPFVLGPVGGGVYVPPALYPELGMRGRFHERILKASRRLSALNPLTRLTWRRAKIIVVQNSETHNRLPFRYRSKCRVRPNAWIHAAVHRDRSQQTAGARRKLVFAGRLVPWKGGAVVLKALAALPSYDLTIIGSGSDERRLRRLVDCLGLSARVAFFPWLPQEELWDHLLAADTLALPSLREEASFLAAEAADLGVNVVAFDQGGPAILALDAPGHIHLASFRNGDPIVAFREKIVFATAEITPQTPSSFTEGGRLADFVYSLYRDATAPPGK